MSDLFYKVVTETANRTYTSAFAREEPWKKIYKIGKWTLLFKRVKLVDEVFTL